MIVGQLHLFKKIMVCTLLLVGATSGSSLATMVVDLDRNHKHPLGEVFGNKAGDQAYFSLGNGRAIKILLTETSGKEGAMLKDLVLKRARGGAKPRLLRRHNVKW